MSKKLERTFRRRSQEHPLRPRQILRRTKLPAHFFSFLPGFAVNPESPWDNNTNQIQTNRKSESHFPQPEVSDLQPKKNAGTQRKHFLWPAPCAFRRVTTLRLTRLPRHDRGPVPGGNRSAASCVCTVLRRALYHYATRSPAGTQRKQSWPRWQ